MESIDNKEWERVVKKCHLDKEEVWMAKQMKLTPEKIYSMIRNEKESWKDVVPLRIRRTFDKRFGRRSELNQIKNKQVR